MSTLPIALDAMGGDNAPHAIVEGAKRAVKELGVAITLVGQPEVLEPLRGGLELFAASEVIAMDADPASSVRTMKDSSLVRSAELVRDGKASAMVSAGNTGATMASALLRMGRIKGVARPAIATPIPVFGSTPTNRIASRSLIRAEKNRLAGQSIRRVDPSTRRTVGRLTWKS